jgi:hypothetical protein
MIDINNIDIRALVPIIVGSISLVVLIGLLINRFSGGESEGSGISGKRRKSGKFKGYKSLDKIYDDSEGNDPLSNARMITNIDLSTDKYSCGFLVTYKGNNDRSVECMTGCTEEEDDENSDFCNQYVWPGGDDNLKDTLIDETYIRRREAGRKDE